MNRLRILLCLLLAAMPAGPAAAAHEPERKVLRYALEIAETGFDPVEIDDIYSRDITRNIFDAPLRFAYLAAPGTLEPATADGMPEVSSDYKTFTVRIKKGIYFTDDPAFKGRRRELTAADYVYSYKRIFDPHWNSPVYDTFQNLGVVGMQAVRDEAIKSGRFDYDREVEGLKTLDRYTFQITLSSPSPRFLLNLADASVMGAVAREVVEKYGDGIMAHPVGTGPFRLVQWRRSSFIALERNPDYRTDIFHVTPDPSDPDAQKIARELNGRRLPLIDRVEISIIEESQPRWLSFLNGEADLLITMPRDMSSLALPNGKPAPNLLRKHIQVERAPQIDVTLFHYNMENPVIGGYTPQKIALRRAINLGFDTPESIRTYYAFQAIPAQSPIMPGEYGYDPQLRTENGVSSVARARALLDEYGYLPRHGTRWRDNPDGSPLVIEMSTQPDQRSRIADEIFEKSMDALDLRTRFKVAKWPDQLKAARAGNFMVWTLGQSAYSPDPTDMLKFGYGPASGDDNLSRFKLAAYDELYVQQSQMPDGPERLSLLRQMTALLVAYAPMKFEVHRYVIDMAYPWVRYYRHWPFTMADFWRYIDIDPALRARTLHH
ncbi:MAG TPA: ABC transporter substrate-binding protein [Steroidobacteraceae bacterium]|jgi:ABC-type transport system substrate-binding protein|nr:ABC transporter substrate-binding protein [Steroidobacteraceae bacterium]